MSWPKGCSWLCIEQQPLFDCSHWAPLKFTCSLPALHSSTDCILQRVANAINITRLLYAVWAWWEMTAANDRTLIIPPAQQNAAPFTISLLIVGRSKQWLTQRNGDCFKLWSTLVSILGVWVSRPPDFEMGVVKYYYFLCTKWCLVKNRIICA